MITYRINPTNVCQQFQPAQYLHTDTIQLNHFPIDTRMYTGSKQE